MIYCSLAINISSQNLPGNIGTLEEFSDEPKIVLWYNCDNLDLDDGVKVTQWNGKANNDAILTQTDADHAPIFKKNIFGDKPALYFNGSKNHAEFLSFNNFKKFPSTEITTVIVYRPEKHKGNTLISYSVTNKGDEFSVRNYRSKTGGISCFVKGSANFNENNKFNINEDIIINTRWKSSDGLCDIFKNNKSSLTKNISSGSVIDKNGNLVIGTRQDNIQGILQLANDVFRGYIAEIIVYDSYLNDAQLTVINNSLQEKYGVNFQDFNNDGFDNDTFSTYDKDLIGVGKSSTGDLDENILGGIGLVTNNSFTDENYVFASHNGAINNAASINKTDLVGDVKSAWNRNFYLNRLRNCDVDIIFDLNHFEQGGKFNKTDNYVLLYRNSETGAYSKIDTKRKYIKSAKQIAFVVDKDTYQDGFYTLGTTDEINSPISGIDGRTWYSYGGGDWDLPGNWSTEKNNNYKNDEGFTPSTSPTALIDNVVIQNGSEIIIKTENKSNFGLQVLGTLRIEKNTGVHTFNEIYGNGNIHIEEDNFPVGDATRFNHKDKDGGKVIFVGDGFSLNKKHRFCNVELRLTNSNSIVNLYNNLYIDNTLVCTRGVLNIAGTSNLKVETKGDVHVANGSSITVENRNVRHQWDFYGDLVNNGTIRFTNRNAEAPADDEAINGIVDANFLNDNKDQSIQLNNNAYFYRIEIDKGTDKTHALKIAANDASYWNLFGRWKYLIKSQTSTNDCAIGLLNGTVSIGANININLLGTHSYSIFESARLLIDGGNVVKQNGTHALIVFGTLEVKSGSLNANVSHGITLKKNGTIKVDGGNVSTQIIKTSIEGGSNIGSYIQTGGTVNIEKDLSSTWTPNRYAPFTLPYRGNIFNMSGGTLHIKYASKTGGIFLNSAPENISVTGGKVICDIGTSSNGDFSIISTAPFYDVEFRNETTSPYYKHVLTSALNMTDDQTIDLNAQPLRVLNDLRIKNNCAFHPITSVDNNNEVFIGGSLFIEDGTLYQTKVEEGIPTQVTFQTTVFNQTIGTSNREQIYYGNTDVTDPLTLGNLKLERTHDNVLFISSAEGRVENETLLKVTGKTEILSGTLDQNKYSILLADNIINHDRCGTFFPNGSYPIAGGTPSEALIRINQDQTPNPITIETIDGAIFGNTRLACSPSKPVNLQSDLIIERLEFGQGAIYLKDNNLTIYELDRLYSKRDDYYKDMDVNSEIVVTDVGISAERLFYTDGKASDGGLTIKINQATLLETVNTRKDNTGPLNFPIGYTLDGGTTLYHRPAQVKIKEFHDDGFITIKPVSGELQTSNLNGGEILQHYWRVEESGFTNQPTVAMRFAFRNQTGITGVDKVAGATHESSYVPGYVMSEEPFQRVHEDVNEIVSYGTDEDRTQWVTFNGTSTPGDWDQNTFSGFKLISGSYTCGLPNRFEGAVKVFYSRDGNLNYNAFQSGLNWKSNDTWFLRPNNPDVATYDKNEDGILNHLDYHDSRQPAANDYPKAGDIAIIGWIPHTDNNRNNVGGRGDSRGMPHYVCIEDNDENCAEIIFTQMEDKDGNPCPRNYRLGYVFRPSLIFNLENAHISGAIVSGEGSIWGRKCDMDLSDINTEIFAKNDSSFIVYEWFSNNVIMKKMPKVVPNFMIANDNGGANDWNIYFRSPLTVNGSFYLMGNINLHLSDQSEGDLVINKDLIIYEEDGPNIGKPSGGGAKLLYPNNVNRSIDVRGNLSMNNYNALIAVNPPNPPNSIINNHLLVVGGDIFQKTDGTSENGLKLFTANNEDRISLELNGDENMTFNYVNGDICELHSLTINKGNSKDILATFNTNFNLHGATNGDSNKKALQLLNGSLILNHTGINLSLSEGGSPFIIPSTSGLVIKQGSVSVTGNSNINLDGLLHLDGGKLDMSNGDNSIVYFGSGKAKIRIDKGELLIGGQLRGDVGGDQNILKYHQFDGNVSVGMFDVDGDDRISERSRGVFEILNEGSEFILQAGTLNIYRGDENATRASLFLQPDYSEIGEAAVLSLGGSYTTDLNSIQIRSNIPLASLSILNTKNKKLTIDIKTESLKINNDLSIQGNLTRLIANDNNLYIGGNFTNEGTYLSGTNTTFFNGTNSQNIITNNPITLNILTQSNSNFLTIDNDLTIEGNLNINGHLVDNDNLIVTKGNVFNNGAIVYSGSGEGMKLEGSEHQKLSGNGTYGKLTVNNSNGVSVDGNFTISVKNELNLNDGILDIGEKLLVLEEDCKIKTSNSFGIANMIQTTKAYVDAGIKKHFKTYDGITKSFLIPIGSNGIYAPINFEIDKIENAGSITVKASNEIHPTITEDMESPENVDIVDKDNVLQFYWILRSENIAGFTAKINFQARGGMVKVLSPEYNKEDYITAKLLNNGTLKWEKFDPTTFDEQNNVLKFNYLNANSASITGDYTAGVEPQVGKKGAIPDKVPEYNTKTSGKWKDQSTWHETIPVGGPRGSVVNIRHSVNITEDNKVSYLTNIIGEDAKLFINNTERHRFGDVSGNGYLILDHGQLPSALFDDFTDKDGGTFIFRGNTEYHALSNFHEVRNIIFEGSGGRILPNSNLMIHGDLLINGTNLEVKNEYNVAYDIKGDMTLQNGMFDAGIGENATFCFCGATPQKIVGNFTGTNSFNNLEINNSAGLTLDNTVSIDNKLKLTNGLITTTDEKLLSIENTSIDCVIGGTNTSYVNGPLRKKISSNSSFIFPIGNNSRFGEIRVSDVANSTSFNYWIANYYNHNPKNDGYDPTLFNTPLNYVNKSEYWKVKAPDNSNAKIRIRWDSQSGVSTDPTERKDLRLATWNSTGVWNEIEGRIDDDNNDGTITSLINQNFNHLASGNVFTLGTTTAFIERQWIGRNTNWTDVINWSSGTIPAINTNVTISSSPTGTHFPTIDGNAFCSNLTIENLASVTISKGSHFTIDNDLNNEGSFLINNSTEEDKMSSVIINGKISGTGEELVIFDFDEGERHYYIGIPSSGQTAGVFNAVSTNNTRVNQFIKTTNKWNLIKDNDYKFEKVLEGYTAMFRNSRTVTFKGRLNNDNFSGLINKGWNLVCNPYISWLDLDQMFKLNINDLMMTVYTRTSIGETRDFATYNLVSRDGLLGGSQFIAPMQALWIKPTVNDFNYEVFKSNRVHRTGTLKSSQIPANNKIKLSLKDKQIFDEVLIVFDSKYQSNNGSLDSEKKFSNNSSMPYIYSLKNENKKAINLLGDHSIVDKIPLGMKLGNKCSGEFKLVFSNVNEFTLTNELWLEDKVTSEYINLKEEPIYNFTQEPSLTVDDRFILYFQNPSATTKIKNINKDNGVLIFAVDNKIKVFIKNYIKSDRNKIEIYDTMGRLICVEKDISAKNMIDLNVSGVMIVNVTLNNEIIKEKVITKKR